jgi:hypothetical protein
MESFEDIQRKEFEYLTGEIGAWETIGRVGPELRTGPRLC